MVKGDALKSELEPFPAYQAYQPFPAYQAYQPFPAYQGTRGLKENGRTATRRTVSEIQPPGQITF